MTIQELREALEVFPGDSLVYIDKKMPVLTVGMYYLEIQTKEEKENATENVR